MSDFKVTVDNLRASAKQFGLIERNLNEAERTIRLDGAAGDENVEEAMEKFANDWDIERERLAWKAKDLETALDCAADTYADVEKQLLKSITDSMQP